ncbi:MULTISPECIES: ABC transporter ATP-binding protein [Bacillaceae]|uniref:ABC transporter ATP-binding protein n=1 Tax=Bacillaceae TaxID=186817 RepID=UPI000BFBC115|nr:MULTISPECIES: ABC transporter ATP-binding protein [Bacillaceae]PGT82256.1 multidrug ABC transporter ATP-binding protein [Bacillus sp. AFS040349]UGB31400.1 ABC transporter ATP-binding protein/permease [Metabacillus sp. B2-18]
MLKHLTSPFKYERISMDNRNQLKKKQKVGFKEGLQTVLRIWRYLSEKKGQFFLVLVMVILSSGLGLLGPYLIGKTIDEHIVTLATDGLAFMVIGLIAVFIFHSISLFLQNYWMIGISQYTVNKMRFNLFNHLHFLPISFFDKRQHGELMSRVTNDIENVSSTLNSSVIQIFSSILTLIGTVTVMLWLSPLLTLITLMIIPLMIIGMKWITRRTGSLFKQQQQRLGELNGYIEEVISGQKMIKAYSQEQKVIESFIDKSNNLRKSGFWAQTISGFIPKVMNMLNNLSFAIIAGIGGLFALNGMITIGTIVIFAEYARQFTRPLNDLANQFNTLLSAIAGAERVFDILDEEREKDVSSPMAITELNGEVRFKDVCFSYEQGDDKQTIEGVDFLARPGETVALVGPTGAGKTTVINLISRFYDADQGSIYIDGKNINRISRDSLRNQMAFVLQDTFLFKGTILDNIRYGRMNASDEEVIEAAKLANAESFIHKLPEQYHSLIQHDGNGISHGQKQLLAIARAMLADPKILILDEATSSIDTITELRIQEALSRLMKGRTTFVIAHRLNTIKMADQIIVLKDGKIIEKGTHKQLLEERGFYFDMQCQSEMLQYES